MCPCRVPRHSLRSAWFEVSLVGRSDVRNRAVSPAYGANPVAIVPPARGHDVGGSAARTHSGSVGARRGLEQRSGRLRAGVGFGTRPGHRTRDGATPVAARWNAAPVVAGLRVATIVVLAALMSGLALAAGILRIASSDDAVDWSVSIDGEPIGYVSGVEVQLEEGRHQIVATAPGYQPIDEAVTIRDGVVTAVTLSPQRSEIVETTEEQTLTSRQKTNRLVVVSSPSDREFRIDGQGSTAPASFLVGVGQHTLRSGELELTFEIPEDLVTYLKIDGEQGRILGFNMTPSQEAAIDAATQEEAFEEGYRLYGQTRGALERFAVSAFSRFEGAIAGYVPSLPYLRDDAVTRVAAVAILSLVALLLVWGLLALTRHRLGAPRAARKLVGRAARATKRRQSAGLMGEEETERRLAARLDRMRRRRDRFAQKLRKRVLRAQQVLESEDVPKRSVRRAKRRLRRSERALAHLQRFPDLEAEVPEPDAPDEPHGEANDV